MNDIEYEFRTEDVNRFVYEIGAKVRNKYNELQFHYCPYCHGGKNGDKFTFSINMTNGKYKCQRASCSVQGNMITLARDFGFQLSENVSRYYNINNYNGKFKKFKEAHRKIESTNAAIDYLASRGISKGVAERYEITTSDKFGDKNILVFPFKNEKGELKFIKYRNINYKKGETKGSKEWCEANCMPILFGMNQCNLENKTLIITEGQLDSLSVAESGFENAVSVPTGCNGFTWIAHCWDFVHQFEKIIVFGDFENGNITLLSEIKKKFKLQIYHVREIDYLDCKDANEILQKYGQNQIKTCIRNAVRVQLNRVINLSEVKKVNIYDMPKVKTHIDELDKLLYGGIPFGGVTLISGKPGEGKSTLGSQILLSAMSQGYKCFAYSGELPNYMFKEWMDFQASSGHVREYQDSAYGVVKYLVTEDVEQRIKEWYSDKCFLYDNDDISEEDEEHETLCSLIEKTVLQYDVKVVLIDNLMTALDMEAIAGTDKYEKQSLFMKKLTRLALKYNIAVLLVAHKRKNAQSTNENDEVSGAGDIANLAMLTLSYQKDKKLAPDQRLLKVSKNRLFGMTNDEGWITYYQQSTKRIFISDADRDFDYGIDFSGEMLGFHEANEADIPF